jgi:hypothetical protein
MGLKVLKLLRDNAALAGTVAGSGDAIVSATSPVNTDAPLRVLVRRLSFVPLIFVDPSMALYS